MGAGRVGGRGRGWGERMIVGTAGHIDHGKTALVRALTGVDTDRLPEEKRRGITIELGFAPLELPGVGTVGVVDVPGHEAFVRTMVAGATGVDVALLVVAADESVMPQTREHVAILRLLGVTRAVVALTKCDLVDDDWAELVTEDVRALLADAPFAGAPIVPVSAVTGSGLDALRAAIADAATAAPARAQGDVFRMPVDRAFTVRGTGTVVTGTVWSGVVEREAALRIFPGGRVARVRGVQVHGRAAGAARAGGRAAVALAGVDVDEVGRGAVLVDQAAWRESTVLRADVELLERVAPLSPRARVRFHLGTADVGARVVGRGGLAPGGTAGARVVLDEPLVARAGDRFVLRGGSPLTTIGGGVVVDPQPPGRRARPWLAPHASTADRLALAVVEADAAGVEESALPVRLGAHPAEVEVLLTRADGSLIRRGGRVFAATVLTALRDQIRRAVADGLARTPLAPGLSLQAVRAALRAPAELVDAALRDAAGAGAVEVEGALIRTPGWRPALTAGQRSALEAL
ncbi:MAG TPA: selenocysteine-specific translation elongation factor, partial [Gemmatimonadaceae bacterium]|nr:selenocysteine-specific translation elongation factor [Gemmatimonadaceae bacterium]